MNKQAHLVVPELFLPQEISAKVRAGLQLAALEKILARAQAEPLAVSNLEDWLCTEFGVTGQAVAPVTLQADGIEPGGHYWLRADPVTLHLMHDHLVLQPALPIAADEAAQMCAALNGHFAADGLHFLAPHPQRWYLRLAADDPQVATFPLAQAAGKNIRDFLPQGAQALRWHAVFNEIQMLLHAHPLNEARERRGAPAINGLWLWGGGRAGNALRQPAARLYTDSPLAAAFAAVAKVDHMAQPEESGSWSDTLVVWDGLRAALQYDDLGAWRDALQHFEEACAAPLLRALGDGRIGQLTLDVPQQNGAQRFVLRRADLWKFWRRGRPLHQDALV